MQTKLSPRTRRNIRKVIKFLNEDRAMTNQQLADKMRMCISSVSRLKKLAIQHGYGDVKSILNTKYLQYKQSSGSGTQLVLNFQEPQTLNPEPTPSAPAVDAVTIDLTATAVPMSQPAAGGEVPPTNIAVATIMRKLASVIAGNNHPDIWRDISAYAQLMLAQTKAVERTK